MLSVCENCILVGASGVALVAAFLRIKAMRRLDLVSAVVNFAYKCGLFRLFTALGLNKRARIAEYIASNGEKLFTDTNFFAVEEVLSLRTRENDIFIASYPKAGTTWVQEIVWLICNKVDIQAARKQDIRARSPFLEIVDVPAAGIVGLQSVENWPESKQRIIKTHMPFGLLPLGAQSKSESKIIYVARNPKDICVSQFHYHRAFKRMPSPGTWNDFFFKFCEGNVLWGGWFDHTLKYWEEHKKDKKRIHFVTYEALKKNLRAEITSIATFLGKSLTENELDTLEERCSFESMSRNDMTNYSRAQRSGLGFKVSKFMRKGVVGDWKNHFTLNQNLFFDNLYRKKMEGSDLAFEFELDG